MSISTPSTASSRLSTISVPLATLLAIPSAPSTRRAPRRPGGPCHVPLPYGAIPRCLGARIGPLARRRLGLAATQGGERLRQPDQTLLRSRIVALHKEPLRLGPILDQFRLAPQQPEEMPPAVQRLLRLGRGMRGGAEPSGPGGPGGGIPHPVLGEVARQGCRVKE